MPHLKKCRNDNQPKAQADFQDCFFSDGILCNISIQCRPLKIPVQNEKFNSVPNRTKFPLKGMSRERDQRISTGLTECLEEALCRLRKEELCHYVAQLLMEQRPLNIFGNYDRNWPFSTHEELRNDRAKRIQGRQDGCGEEAKARKGPKNTMSTFVNLPRNEGSGCTVEGKSKENCCQRHSIETDNSSGMAVNSKEDLDDETFRRIIRVIDILCDIRPLIDEISYEQNQAERREIPAKRRTHRDCFQELEEQLCTPNLPEARSDSALRHPPTCHESSEEPLITRSQDCIPIPSQSYACRNTPTTLKTSGRQAGYNQNQCRDQYQPPRTRTASFNQVPRLNGGCGSLMKSTPECTDPHFTEGLSLPEQARDRICSPHHIPRSQLTSPRGHPPPCLTSPHISLASPYLRRAPIGEQSLFSH